MFTPREVIHKYSERRFFCVYRLIKEGVVVYVGSSGHLANRMHGHLCSVKDFDFVEFDIIENRYDLPNAEAKQICEYNPKYNIVMPDNDHFTTIKAAKAKMLMTINNQLNDVPVCFSNARTDYVDVESLAIIDDAIVSAIECALEVINNKKVTK